nr:hypothetical protein [Tanacetum cinerariifolium]
YKLLIVQIMTTSAIIVSSDSSDESVGSSPSRVILFGDIPTVILSTSMIAPETSAIAPVISSVAPVVETTIVASPTGLSTSLFLYINSSEASDSCDGPPSQDPYAITVARRPYRTHPNGPRRVMTVRKQVRPLRARRLAWRCVSPRSSDHCPSSSSSLTNSSLVHSSGLYAPESSSGDSSERPLHSAGPSRKRYRFLTNSVPSSTPVTGSLAPTRADLSLPRKRFRDSYSPETSMEEDTRDTEIDTTETEDGRELDIIDGDDVRDHIEVSPRDDREEFEASAGDTILLGIDPRSVPMVDEEVVEPVGGESSSSSGTRDGTVRVMTVRKQVRPLRARRLAWRRVSPRSSDHCPSSSSSLTNSSLVHSSGLYAPGQAHSRSSTRVVSPRLGYPSVRAP